VNLYFKDQNCLTLACGKFGLAGFTVTNCVAGVITKSMSSMGTAPKRTSSPMTRAPTKQFRSSNLTSTGPTYGTFCDRPSAVVTSLRLLSLSSSCCATCCGRQSECPSIDKDWA